jgi:hypothetical protein
VDEYSKQGVTSNKPNKINLDFRPTPPTSLQAGRLSYSPKPCNLRDSVKDCNGGSKQCSLYDRVIRFIKSIRFTRVIRVKVRRE